MSKPAPSRWNVSKEVARAVLHDRQSRRKTLANFAFLLLGMLAAGLWLIADWLDGNLWRFIIWWGGVFCLTLFVILFAVYDIFCVIREERNRPG